MQEKILNTKIIIDKLKKIYNLHSDTDISKLFNLSNPSILTNWKQRNSLDFNKLLFLLKEKNVDLNDFFFGVNYSNHFHVNIYENIVNEPESKYDSSKKEIEYLAQINILKQIILEMKNNN